MRASIISSFDCQPPPLSKRIPGLNFLFYRVAHPAVSHITNFLATGRLNTAEPQDPQAIPRTYAVVLQSAIIMQTSHILCFSAFTNAPKQRVCWYMTCAAHFCTVIWIWSLTNFCNSLQNSNQTFSSSNLFTYDFLFGAPKNSRLW